MASPRLLSIVVPCYNAGAAIVTLMQMIAAQLDDDCELIVVNDGSTDHTGHALRGFAKSHRGPGHIHIEETANAGAARARATGLAMSTGEFVYFCDSDDVMQADFVACFRASVLRYPALDMLFFSSDMAVEQADGSLQRLRAKLHYAEAHVFADGAALLDYNLRHRMYSAAVWTYVARRALIERSGASFTHRHAHEDHLFTLRALIGAVLVVAVPDTLYVQRVRPGSLTNSSKTSAYLLDRIRAFDEADAFLRAHRIGARALYQLWSFEAIYSMLKAHRSLLPAVLFSKTGAVYAVRHIPALWALLVAKMRRAAQRAPLHPTR